MFAALPAFERERILRARERFHLDPAEWYQRPATPPCLRTLATAVLADHAVAIDYESWKGRKVRVVEPLGLVLKAGAWYMVAPNSNRYAIYRVESIHTIRTLEKRKVPRRSFHLARVWQQEVSHFEASLRRARAASAAPLETQRRSRDTDLRKRQRCRFFAGEALRIHESAMSRLSRLGADSAEAIRGARLDAEGWRTANIWIESVPPEIVGILCNGLSWL
jgi:predicted DNA-binding transcriptional regulator YafY